MLRKAAQTLKQIWSNRGAVFKIGRTLLYRRRCYKCGLLGLQEIPPPAGTSDFDIEDLREFKTQDRNLVDQARKSLRQEWPRRREFDYRKHNNLGQADWIKGGVTCGVSDPRGPNFSYTTPELMGEIWRQRLDDGAIIRVTDLSAPMGSRVVAVVTTFLEPLIKPHDCEHYRRYRPGLSPSAHIKEPRERIRTLLQAIGAFVGIVGIAVTIVIAILSSG